MAEKGKGWGSIFWGTRTEKLVDSLFLEKWSHLLWAMATELGRPGDGFSIARDRPAHKNANDLVRKFLESSCDSLLLIDSDADFGPNIITEIRDFEPGWDYDILQAFYTRRGWPPEAIWFTKNDLGDLAQNWVLNEGTMDVARIGTHFVIIRREVFEKMRDERDPSIELDDYEWFFYPRHVDMSEDAAFSDEALEQHGFKLGATTRVKVGHISRVVTGWETYQNFLEISGQKVRIRKWLDNIELVARFLGEDPELVRAKANKGSANVREGLERYLSDGKFIQDLDTAETRKFYGDEYAGYIYELIAWNLTVLYDQTVGILRDHVVGESCLVVGGGIGGEIDALREKNAVIVFELPGLLREFLIYRYNLVDNVQIYTEPKDLREIQAPPDELKYNWTIAVDTVEHFHPEDFESTLDKMLELTADDGFLFFRNNFEQFDKYPMHFDHAEAFARWIAERELILDAAYGELGVEIYRRYKEGIDDQAENIG